MCIQNEVRNQSEPHWMGKSRCVGWKPNHIIVERINFSPIQDLMVDVIKNNVIKGELELVHVLIYLVQLEGVLVYHGLKFLQIFSGKPSLFCKHSNYRQEVVLDVGIIVRVIFGRNLEFNITKPTIGRNLTCQT